METETGEGRQNEGDGEIKRMRTFDHDANTTGIQLRSGYLFVEKSAYNESRRLRSDIQKRANSPFRRKKQFKKKKRDVRPDNMLDDEARSKIKYISIIIKRYCAGFNII
ncbi:MAG: hypothetical protein AAB347_14025 [Bacteroidota bacterium]